METTVQSCGAVADGVAPVWNDITDEFFGAVKGSYQQRVIVDIQLILRF